MIKSGIVRCISSNFKVILQSNDGSFHQMHFEGFQITPDNAYRSQFDVIINKSINVNKSYKIIKHVDVQLFTQLLKKKAVRILAKELQESKLYTSQQKQIFKESQNNHKEINKSIKIVDYEQNRNQLPLKWNNLHNISAIIQCFNSEILVRITEQQQISYVPISLQDLNLFFNCISQATLTPLLIPNQRVLKIWHMKVIYNLQRNRYQVRVQLQRNFEQQILKRGCATIRMSNMNQLNINKLNKFIKLQKQAKLQHRGIFEQVSKVLSFIFTKNNFVGIVTDIIEGYIYQVTSNINHKKIRIQLNLIWCPIDQQIGAYQCREFARRNLIGKQVNVYLSKDSVLNINGSIVRVSDSKDIQFLLLENGWAHIRQQFKNSLVGAKYEECYNKVRNKQKGLHKKQLGHKLLQELSVQLSLNDKHQILRRQQLLNFFNSTEEAVIDTIVDSIVYKVRVETKKVIIRVRLEGIKGVSVLNPILPEVRQLKERIREYINFHFKKRTVILAINQYDSNTNCYIGSMRLIDDKKQTFQQKLIEQGMVYVDKKNKISNQHLQMQNICRKQNKNIWQQKLNGLQPIDLLEEENKEFQGRFSWFFNAEDVYIQSVKFYQKLDLIQQNLNKGELKLLQHKNMIIGTICVAPYMNDYYRAKILSIKNKKVEVFFIDWGNQETINQNNLFQLPKSLQYIRPQCFKVQMYLWKPIKKNIEILDQIRSQLLEIGNIKLTKIIGLKVEVQKDSINLNKDYIQKGLIRSDNFVICDDYYKEILFTIQQNLRKERIGIWQWSDQEEEEQNQQDYFDQIE